MNEIRTSLQLSQEDRESLIKQMDIDEQEKISLVAKLNQYQTTMTELQTAKDGLENTLLSKMNALRELEEIRSTYDAQLFELQRSKDGLESTLQSKMNALREIEELQHHHNQALEEVQRLKQERKDATDHATTNKIQNEQLTELKSTHERSTERSI